MDPLSELSFSCRTDRLDYVPGEAVVNLLFVIVNCNNRVREMPNIAKHIKRISESHQVIIHLIEPMSIIDDLSEEGRE